MFLVDGNNVMAQRVGWHRDKVLARRRLLDELARFASSRGARVDVVFDGAPDEQYGDGASYRGYVRVFYAARGSNADERIKAIVEATRERRTLRVVTSDRALADYVRRCGVRVVRSGEFRRLLEQAGEGSGPTADNRPVITDSTDEWLRYFGVGLEDDE